MPKGHKREIKYKNGEIITPAELARREDRSYSTIMSKLKINPDATWQELVARQRKFLVVVDGVIMDTTAAGKQLGIARGNVIDRWRKLVKGEITMADYHHHGPKLNQKKKGKRNSNEEWAALGKNKKNGTKAQRDAKLRRIPSATEYEKGLRDRTPGRYVPPHLKGLE